MREGQFRNLSGCAISGIFSRSGKRFSGERIIESISTMRERSNGLGGGFAAYGIYPEYKEYYAFHIFYNDNFAKKNVKNSWGDILILSTFQRFLQEEYRKSRMRLLSGGIL